MPRRGYTLMEMLIVIAMSTVLMGVAVSVLNLLMRAERAGREHVSRTATVARLADQFRNDVRAAQRLVAADGAPKNQWQFALAPDRVATYRASPGEMERREEVAGKLVRQESYALPGGCSARIIAPTDSVSTIAGLVIAPSGPASSIGNEIRIDAALGADRRFAKSEGGR
jgi:prepilin-type N-terminal cleavage/methylation domain-containing protein